MENEVFETYFDYYINKVKHLNRGEALEAGKEKVLAYLRDLDPDKLHFAYDEDKWTVSQVLLHIMDVERVMAFRALSFARGEENELPGFDHEVFALAAPTDNYSKESLMKEYSALRQSTVSMFHHLSQEQLDKTGVFGGNKLSVGEIWYMISGHEEHHLDVLFEKY